VAFDVLQVAGGLSSGVGIYQTALKEAEEEANVPKELAETMKAVGCVT
jgi:8-oxo-dGTP pyrophosphatase MutT (NUDIX family)